MQLFSHFLFLVAAVAFLVSGLLFCKFAFVVYKDDVIGLVAKLMLGITLLFVGVAIIIGDLILSVTYIQFFTPKF